MEDYLNFCVRANSEGYNEKKRKIRGFGCGFGIRNNANNE